MARKKSINATNNNSKIILKDLMIKKGIRKVLQLGKDMVTSALSFMSLSQQPGVQAFSVDWFGLVWLATCERIIKKKVKRIN
jgi:hypothetical protein